MYVALKIQYKIFSDNLESVLNFEFLVTFFVSNLHVYMENDNSKHFILFFVTNGFTNEQKYSHLFIYNAFSIVAFIIF